MSVTDPTPPDPYPPPDDEAVNRAIEAYAQAVREAYGERVKGIYLFGSRARGDHTPESDADIAVVLADGDWDYWAERMRLTDLEYDFLIDTGADLQAWPVSESAWQHPERGTNPHLIRAMHRDGLAIPAPQ